MNQRSRFFEAMRRSIRLWQTQRASVSFLEQAARSILMLPFFTLLFVVLRLRLRWRGPLDVDATTAHGEFCCHPPDLIQMYLWLFGVWEPDMTVYIREHLAPGDVFIDVGANIGYYGAVATRPRRQQGDQVVRVVAVEASPVVFAALQQTIALNHLNDEVRAINKAAADKRGTIAVYAGPQHNIGLTTTVQQRGMKSEAQIEAVPLDDLLEPEEIRNARLIKIDVEGAEPQVLAGMSRIVRECRQEVEILIELSPQWWADTSLRPVDVLQPFLNAGFHVYQMQNNYWPWRYLWPNAVMPPKRSQRDLTQRVKRLDVVLSRRDAAEL